MSLWRAVLITALVLAALAHAGRLADSGSRLIEKQVQRFAGAAVARGRVLAPPAGCAVAVNLQLEERA